MAPLLELINVDKFFGERLIFRKVNLSLETHCLYLLTGSNGCGKSTLLRIIAGLTRADGGQISKKDSLKIAYLGHPVFAYPALTALQNLEFWSRLCGLKKDSAKLMEILGKVELADRANDLVRTFSRGMAQRLNFARILLSGADVLLLDEPYTGMDEKSRTILGKETSLLKQKGAAILLVTHDTNRENTICDAIFKIENKLLCRQIRENIPC